MPASRQRPFEPRHKPDCRSQNGPVLAPQPVEPSSERVHQAIGTTLWRSASSSVGRVLAIIGVVDEEDGPCCLAKAYWKSARQPRQEELTW